MGTSEEHLIEIKKKIKNGLCSTTGITEYFLYSFITHTEYLANNNECHFISTLRKDIFVATENSFLSINASEHIAWIKIVKGH